MSEVLLLVKFTLNFDKKSVITSPLGVKKRNYYYAEIIMVGSSAKGYSI